MEEKRNDNPLIEDVKRAIIDFCMSLIERRKLGRSTLMIFLSKQRALITRVKEKMKL